jgi:hypothetical protein
MTVTTTFVLFFSIVFDFTIIEFTICSIFAVNLFTISNILVHRPFDIRNRPRIPVPDEDPYVAAGIDSSGSSGFGNDIYGHVTREQIMMQSQYPPLRRDKPPKLPPRGDNLYGHEMSSVMKVKKTKFKYPKATV